VYRATLQRFPDDPVTYHGLAEVMRAQGRLAEAEAMYREVLRRWPNDAYSQAGLERIEKRRGPADDLTPGHDAESDTTAVPSVPPPPTVTAIDRITVTPPTSTQQPLRQTAEDVDAHQAPPLPEATDARPPDDAAVVLDDAVVPVPTSPIPPTVAAQDRIAVSPPASTQEPLRQTAEDVDAHQAPPLPEATDARPPDDAAVVLNDAVCASSHLPDSANRRCPGSHRGFPTGLDPRTPAADDRGR